MWMMLLGAAQAEEATEWSPMVQVRPRFEAHSGRDGASGGDDFFFSQRSRGGVNATRGRLSGTFLIQDVRIWGSETNSLGDFSADGFDVAVAQMTVALSDIWSLELGRNERNLHEQRLIGAVGWTQQARSFDGVVLRAKSDEWSADLATNVLFDDSAGVTTGVTDTTLLSWLRAGRSTENSTTDVLVISENTGSGLSSGSANNSRMTAGVYLKGKSGILSGRLEGYGQFGGNDVTTINAMMLGVSGTVSPESELKPKITLWYDMLSGDDDVTDTDVKAFNTLYATNHKFYGLADIVAFGRGAMSDGRGLHDAALKLGIKPGGIGLNLDAHYFAAADAQGGDAGIGQEVDLWTAFKVVEGTKLAAGAAVFMPADSNLDMDSWGFLQLDARFK